MERLLEFKLYLPLTIKRSTQVLEYVQAECEEMGVPVDEVEIVDVAPPRIVWHDGSKGLFTVYHYEVWG